MNRPRHLRSNLDFERAHEEVSRQRRVEEGDGGGTVSDMEERVTKLELATAKTEGQLDWAKIVATTILGVMLAGFSLLAAITLSASNRSDASAAKLEAQVAGVSAKLADEFRAQRQEQAAQITAISNAITASKQQPPQVLLVPAPTAGGQPPGK